jgi:hypothetical protein
MNGVHSFGVDFNVVPLRGFVCVCVTLCVCVCVCVCVWNCVCVYMYVGDVLV